MPVSSVFIVTTSTWQVFNNYLLDKYTLQQYMNPEAVMRTQLSTTKPY